MGRLRSVVLVIAGVCPLAPTMGAEEKKPKPPTRLQRIDAVLAATRPLTVPRRMRLPLYVWPAADPGVLDDAAADRLVKALDERGIGLYCSWSPRRREMALAQGLAIARAQVRLGTPVNINATACLQSFFNGDEQTAHVDGQGNRFWDDSFNQGTSKHKIGCPFALEGRKDPIRQQVDCFARAYQEARLPVDFVFADWEIDGPLEYNRAHEAAQRCVRCRKQFQEPGNFLEFQKALRQMRAELQRYALAAPLRERFPAALVGNYAEYPCDGYRYWYDYFEYFVDGQPHVADQRAKYRVWSNEFPGTGYTCAMPVVYTWYPTFGWYDFENPDYRWFYSMLLVASNAGKSTPVQVPIVSFVHWHTTAPPSNPDPQVKQFSRTAYQELLWHMLLRGTDTFFLWCPAAEDVEECQLVHDVYAAAQQFADFFSKGTPVCFDVPKRAGAVLSAVLLDKKLLVRRTDFAEVTGTVNIQVGTKNVAVAAAPGKCQIIDLP